MSEPGRITRWRLAEPVRFYLWPVLAALVVFFTLAVVNRWWESAVMLGGGILLLFTAVELARASVFCEVSHYRECRDTALRAVRGELIP